MQKFSGTVNSSTFVIINASKTISNKPSSSFSYMSEVLSKASLLSVDKCFEFQSSIFITAVQFLLGGAMTFSPNTRLQQELTSTITICISFNSCLIY